MVPTRDQHIQPVCPAWVRNKSKIQSMRRRKRLRRLRPIYAEMRSWSRDNKSVPRVLQAVDPSAKLAVIGEAAGPRTLRLSGVNYFDAYGRLGPTGRYLDEILRPLGYTVYPRTVVTVRKGVIACVSGESRRTAYFTDLCPVFPGYRPLRRRTQGILAPSRVLIDSALERKFLKRELDIVKPRVILLLGRHAYEAFYLHFLRLRPRRKLSSLLRRMRTSALSRYNGAVVVPFFHPSPASPTFTRWYTSFSLRPPLRNPLIRALLEHLE
jgi:uracil-DNA glycosylase